MIDAGASGTDEQVGARMPDRHLLIKCSTRWSTVEKWSSKVCDAARPSVARLARSSSLYAQPLAAL